MKLCELIKNIPGASIFPEGADIDIQKIVIDDRAITPNSLFVCLRGGSVDGHNFAQSAVKNGAVAIVTERFIPKIKTAQVVVGDTRSALSYLSASFFGEPQKKLKIIGVVGTNGKTSVSHITAHLLNSASKKAAVIGTLGAKCGQDYMSTDLTTPDPFMLFSLLDKFVKAGASYVVMEVSAHAISLKKVAAIDFEVLIFTNCTHDHLDYFTDFSGYRQVKKSIFAGQSRFFVVNTDDVLGREIYSSAPHKSVTYALNAPSDVFAINLKESQEGLSFVLNMFDMVYKTKTRLLGEFNVSNCLAAACAAFLCGVKPFDIAKAVQTIAPVSGRLEKIATVRGANVFLDYAHTPDGLDKSLSFVSATCVRDTYCVFGCGGNRDKQKRPIMGRIAGDIADFVVVTSDNPRDEKPESIIRDIEVGIRSVSLDYITIIDRKSAIEYALERLECGDSLLIAGKGAEEYQEVKGERLAFSDRQVVLDYLSGLEKTNNE